MTGSILKDISEALEPLGVPIETGIFSTKAPDEYLVLIPMSDIFDHFADDLPCAELQEVRLSLFSKGNYLERKNAIVHRLLSEAFTITDRRYLGYEEDTGFHHFAIDVAKEYETNI
jgi:hypothetical protein